jgi:hypothetical protein
VSTRTVTRRLVRSALWSGVALTVAAVVWDRRDQRKHPGITHVTVRTR